MWWGGVLLLFISLKIFQHMTKLSFAKITTVLTKMRVCEEGKVLGSYDFSVYWDFFL